MDYFSAKWHWKPIKKAAKKKMKFSDLQFLAKKSRLSTYSKCIKLKRDKVRLARSQKVRNLPSYGVSVQRRIFSCESFYSFRMTRQCQPPASVWAALQSGKISTKKERRKKFVHIQDEEIDVWAPWASHSRWCWLTQPSLLPKRQCIISSSPNDWLEQRQDGIQLACAWSPRAPGERPIKSSTSSNTCQRTTPLLLANCGLTTA